MRSAHVLVSRISRCDRWVPAQTQPKVRLVLTKKDRKILKANPKAGVPPQTADAIVAENEQARIDGLRTSLSLLALIALIENGMVLAKVDPYWVQFLLGALILAAVWLNRWRAVSAGAG